MIVISFTIWLLPQIVEKCLRNPFDWLIVCFGLNLKNENVADHHGSTKVDFWKQPTNPGNWKEEHVPFISLLVCVFYFSFLLWRKPNLQFVLISLSGWGLLFYSGYKLFTGGKGDDEVIAFSSSFTKQTKQSGSLFLYSLQNFDSSFAEACAMNLSLGKDKESSPSRAGLVSNKASKITSLTVFVCFLLK